MGDAPFRIFVFRSKHHLVVGIPPQNSGNVAKLGGEIGVEEQNAHREEK